MVFELRFEVSDPGIPRAKLGTAGSEFLHEEVHLVASMGYAPFTYTVRVGSGTQPEVMHRDFIFGSRRVNAREPDR